MGAAQSYDPCEVRECMSVLASAREVHEWYRIRTVQVLRRLAIKHTKRSRRKYLWQLVTMYYPRNSEWYAATMIAGLRGADQALNTRWDKRLQYMRARSSMEAKLTLVTRELTKVLNGDVCVGRLGYRRMLKLIEIRKQVMGIQSQVPSVRELCKCTSYVHVRDHVMSRTNWTFQLADDVNAWFRTYEALVWTPTVYAMVHDG